MTTLFISGIDTEIGKTIACGALAKALLQAGLNVFTQKWVETGVRGKAARSSADLATHEKIAGVRFNLEDPSLHAPYLFEIPASPHLAASLEGTRIDPALIESKTKKLQSKCQHLLIEGAGGLCVPLNENVLTIELVKKMKLPVVLVTSGRLGSINHTILSLDYCKNHNIEVRAVIYNSYPNTNPQIRQNSRSLLKQRTSEIYKNAVWLDLHSTPTSLDMNSAEMSALLTEQISQ